MNGKIKDYVEVLFSDIPRSKKANELKEEMLSNISERFEDYIQEGKTENQAYSLVIGSLGDIDELLADVMPSKESQNLDSKHSRLLNNILTIYWIIIAFIYLAISFTTMLWGITWIIFVLASVFHFLLKAIFEMKYSDA